MSIKQPAEAADSRALSSALPRAVTCGLIPSSARMHICKNDGNEG